MSETLSYPALRCVLEHLEPNKRIHIAARTPLIRDIDRSIPIHFDIVEISEKSYNINHTHYTIDTRSINRILLRQQPRVEPEHLIWSPGDVKIGFDDLFENHEQPIQLIFLGRSLYNRRVNVLPHVAMKKWGNVFFAYEKVYVNKLEFGGYGPMILRLPVGLKFIMKKLIIRDNEFSDFTPLFHDSTILQSLQISQPCPETLAHPLVKNSEKLNVYGVVPLESLTNKHVQIHCHYYPNNRKDLVSRMVEKWKNLEDGEVGKSFTFFGFDSEQVSGTLAFVRERFGGEFKNLKIPFDKEHFFIMPNSTDSHHPVPYCLSIPINFTSELNIYGMAGVKFLKMEIMKIGASEPFGPTTGAPPEPMLPVIQRGFDNSLVLKLIITGSIALFAHFVVELAKAFWKSA